MSGPPAGREPGAIVVQGLERLEAGLGRLFVVVGVFDGLHRGHAYLLRRLVRESAARGARPAVITFDAHPEAVLSGHAPPLLLDPDERLGRLAQAGIAVAVVVHFDDALRRTPYDAFVRSIAARVDLAGFLMTPEAAFGHERRGTPATVAELGRELGYATVVAPRHVVDGVPVSSTAIRAAISAGDLGRARRLLGRDVAFTGRVEGGAVRFDLPVALPPDGPYDARLEAPWTSSGPPSRRRAEPATVEVGGGRIALARPAPRSAAPTRLRVRLPVNGRPATIRGS